MDMLAWKYGASRAALVLVIAAACGVSVGCTTSPAGTSTVIGPAGGAIRAGDVTLAIPAGALSSDQTITITATDLPAPAGYALYSRIFDFEPSGIRFARPVVVTIAFRGDPSLAHFYWSNASGTGYDDAVGTVGSGAMTAVVTHFSGGWVGTPSSDGPGMDASSLIDSEVGPDASMDGTTEASADSGGSTDATRDAARADVGSCTASSLTGSYTIANSRDLVGIQAVTEITGDLTIASPGLADLALPCLEAIGGALRVGDTADGSTHYESVSLPRLRTVGGDIGVWAVTSFDATRLTTVGGNLQILSSSTPLADVTGLASLTTVGGVFEVSNIGATSLSGLDNLTTAGSLDIVENSQLRDLTGLGSLTHVGSLYITGNAALVSTAGLGPVPTVAGNLRIEGNPVLADLRGMESVTTVGSELRIGGNGDLTTLNDLDHLTRVALLDIEGNASLSMLGLDMLAVADVLIIQNNPALDTCLVRALRDRLAPPPSVTTIMGNGACASDGGVSSDGGNDAGPPYDAGPPFDGCVMFSHSDTRGDSYDDCYPTGVFNAFTAADACTAYLGAYYPTVGPCVSAAICDHPGTPEDGARAICSPPLPGLAPYVVCYFFDGSKVATDPLIVIAGTSLAGYSAVLLPTNACPSARVAGDSVWGGACVEPGGFCSR